MPQQPARPSLRAAQAVGLTVFFATATILSALLITRLTAGLGSPQAAAAAFSTACAAIAAFAMLADAMDLWVRGRRMTVHSVKMVRSLVFVAVLAALAASILGGNALVGLVLSPAMFTYLFISRRSTVPLAGSRRAPGGSTTRGARGGTSGRASTPAKARQRRGGKKRR